MEYRIAGYGQLEEVSRMLLLRGLGASVLWLVAGIVGLLGVLLSATIILLPVGIPLLMLAKKILTTSMAVLMPKKVRHPAAAAKDSVQSGAKKVLGKRSSPKKTAKRFRKKVSSAVS